MLDHGNVSARGGGYLGAEVMQYCRSGDLLRPWSCTVWIQLRRESRIRSLLATVRFPGRKGLMKTAGGKRRVMGRLRVPGGSASITQERSVNKGCTCPL